jgi:hypothetical protein
LDDPKDSNGVREIVEEAITSSSSGRVSLRPAFGLWEHRRASLRIGDCSALANARRIGPKDLS